MSKTPKRKQKSFSYTPINALPSLKPLKTEWNLSRHFYSSERDPKIRKDIEETKKHYAQFVKRYEKKDFTKNAHTLKRALVDYAALIDSKGHKPSYYVSYRLTLNAHDHAAEKMQNKLEEELTKLGNTLVFFELRLGMIPKAQQRAYLKDPSLKEFHFYLSGVFEHAAHNLSEKEEKILALKSQTSRSMWISGTEKIIGTTTIRFEGKEIPLYGALMQYMDLPSKLRHGMWKQIACALEKLGPIAENELNAIITDKKINDELRHYTKPYSATALSYDQTDSSVEALVSAVEKRGYALAHTFFAYKAKKNGKKLAYIDREDCGGDLPNVSFETAVAICRDAFYGFNPEYGAIFDDIVTSGRIDVYPKKGKGGGAFCSSGINTETLVMLNHTNDFQSVKTLAHEMGHAVHVTRSKLQPLIYSDHSTVTAETASTFFEAVLGDRLMSVFSDTERATFLNSLINDKISTIMMCVARFKAELEIHEHIRTHGAMTWQDMSATLRKHFQAYSGPSVICDPTDGHLVISKVHYRLNFYQYTYAFGNIASSIMWQRCRDDVGYRKEVDRFLRAGRSANVADIFKSIGIDVTSPHVFAEGLALLERDIKEFIRLTS